MNWDHLAARLDDTLSTPLPVGGGMAYVADEVPGMYSLLEDATESEADRNSLDEDGWYVVTSAWTLRELLSFDYLSSPAGGSLIWWLLDTGDGRRYLIYQPDDEEPVVFARLSTENGEVDAVIVGSLIERFLATSGEALGVEESFTMLPDLINNREPELLDEAPVRGGALAFMEYAEEHYGGWEYLSKGYPDPQTRDEKEAAFADYWRRHYTEAENPYEQ